MKTKILYLYSELMGYQIPVLQELVKKYNTEIHIIHWDKKKLTPYTPPKINSVEYYDRSNFNTSKLKNFIKSINPDIIYISGWMDKVYLNACKSLKRSIPIIAGCDTQYKGTWKQRIGIPYFKIKLKKIFTHIWVAGPYQYEYASRLGFKKEEVLFNCLTADTHLFNLENREKVKHNFLYAGNLEIHKGVRDLIQAWNMIENKKNWTLTIIGTGSLKKEIKENKDVKLKNFMNPNELSEEFKNAGCFVLSSHREQWGLVIHEASASSLPIIASTVCGAVPKFLIPNYNGFTSIPKNVQNLKEKMEYIINMADEELLLFSKRSYQRSKCISPEIVAASFMSVLNK